MIQLSIKTSLKQHIDIDPGSFLNSNSVDFESFFSIPNGSLTINASKSQIVLLASKQTINHYCGFCCSGLVSLDYFPTLEKGDYFRCKVTFYRLIINILKKVVEGFHGHGIFPHLRLFLQITKGKRKLLEPDVFWTINSITFIYFSTAQSKINARVRIV